MSARQQLRQRLRSLREIGEILDSMKTLAVMETHKLARFGATQYRVVAGIERAMDDFCRSFPHTLAYPPAATEVCLLLGSERGFCGDFNEALLTTLAALDQDRPAGKRLVLAVGSRLFPKLQDDSRVVALLNGAGAAEEVPVVLGRAVDTVLDLQGRYNPLALTVLHHELETRQVRIRRLLPPSEILARKHPSPGPLPQVHLPLWRLLAELVDHYLFAGLNEMFYTTLLVENQRRAQHLEGATQRLQEQVAQLTLRANALRQEEITEEIEVILLSAQAGMGP